MTKEQLEMSIVIILLIVLLCLVIIAVVSAIVLVNKNRLCTNLVVSEYHNSQYSEKSKKQHNDEDETCLKNKTILFLCMVT